MPTSKVPSKSKRESSAPPPRASKAPGRTSKAPPRRRETIEVELAWLEQEAKPEEKRNKPPRLPGAARTIPPMPVQGKPSRKPPPPKRETIEIELAWLEQEAKPEERGSKAPRLPGAARTIPPLPVQRKPFRKPIPREEPED